MYYTGWDLRVRLLAVSTGWLHWQDFVRKYTCMGDFAGTKGIKLVVITRWSTIYVLTIRQGCTVPTQMHGMLSLELWRMEWAPGDIPCTCEKDRGCLSLDPAWMWTWLEMFFTHMWYHNFLNFLSFHNFLSSFLLSNFFWLNNLKALWEGQWPHG